MLESINNDVDIQSTTPKMAIIEEKDNYAKFEFGPLEVSWGHSLGNTIRRTLLSAIRGVAITSVKIEGIAHEFTVLPYMKEDILNFILNVKGIRIRNKRVSNLPDEIKGRLRIDVKGMGRVTAADILPSTDFEVVNSSHHLATLTSDEAKLSILFVVEQGMGYKQADQAKASSNAFSHGEIFVDAIFTPVIKVNYSVKNVRVGSRTDFETITFEIWTDGTLSPTSAMQKSGQYISEKIQHISDFNLEADPSDGQSLEYSKIPAAEINKKISELNLSVRTENNLRRGGIERLGEIIKSYPKLRQIRNMGEKSMAEIDEILKNLKVSL